MRAITTASWQVDDLEKAKHLAFDPACYEAVRGGVSDDDSAGFLHSPISSVPTLNTWVSATFDYSTESTTPERIRQQALMVGESERRAAAWVPYIIKSPLSSKKKETLPTRDPESSLSDLIDRVRQHPKIGFAKRVAARLDYLLEVSREEQPEQAPPSALSLESFRAFLSKNPGLVYPDIVLTPDGNVRAQWRLGPEQHFALEFLEDEDVRFVIFAPNPKRPYKTTRVSGVATVDSVLELAAPYRILDWVRDDGAKAA